MTTERLIQLGYGPLGELARQTWTIASDTLGNSVNSPEVYTTRYRYDTWNRMMAMSYPDNENLTYAYDSGGLVKTAGGIKNGYSYDYLKRLEYDKFEQRAFQELGNQTRTAYAYRPDNRRLCALNTAKGGVTASSCPDFANAPDSSNGLQALTYQYDPVGNILGLRNTLVVPPPSQFGGPSKQAFAYDNLYRLTAANGSYLTNPSKTRTYQLNLAYDSIHNILSKQQADVIAQPSGTPITQKKTSYAWTYDYAPSGATSIRSHAPIHIGERTYRYDANGNQTGWDHDQNGTRRNIVWDEENRIQSVFDNGHEKFYKYDDAGERIIKRGPQGETVYVNQYFTLRNREIGTKHVYVGTTRAVSKLMKQDKPGANPNGSTPVEKDLYYFHPDHLGSSNLITDAQGQSFEHLEYFPFGETWVEESTNTQRTPYLFTAKELDEETGLYYFGARYYDPRTSVWQSTDPILEKYLPSAPTKPEESVRLSPPTVRNPLAQFDLPGMGGVFKTQNLGLYGYVGHNPLNLVDPNGEAGEPVNLGSGWSARVDAFNVRGAASHEIHVFNSTGKEAGVLGPKGWIAKHGFTGATPEMPQNVANRLKGINVDIMRKQGLIPPKGEANIKGGSGVVRGAGILGVIGGLLQDVDRLKRAQANGQSFSDQIREDAGTNDFIMTPLGPLPNIYQQGNLDKENKI